MSQQPPPPPPHGENPKTTSGEGAPGGGGSGLGPGNYDIFVIPQRDKGGGFIYLPAMTANGPSFAAGFAAALVIVVIFQSMAPAFQAWWANFQGMGSMGMTLLLIAVGIGAWAWGKSQSEGGFSGSGGGGGGSGNGASYGGGPQAGSSSGGAAPNAGTAPPPPPPPPPRNDPPPNQNAGNERPKPSWQQRPPPNTGGNTRAETPKNSWEKAREETRKKEEERKKKEEDDKRKAEAARRLREFREKEAREREKREREAKEKEELQQKLAKEKAERERLEKEKADREKAEKEAKEKEEARKKELEEKAEARRKELEEKRKKEAEERKKHEAEEAARSARQASTYAYSGVGEKTSPWPKGTPPTPAPKPPSSQTSGPSPTKPARSTASSSQSKRPPAPSARTHLSTDEDAYSFRPYDKPNRSFRTAPSTVGSEASWAQSATTARTTPPPSMRGPYSTKDPDKIMIRAVYLFMNQFAKTPASNLLPGMGTVTDGLILRITTEGLFIDDDVRGVPQREWDVKAWTLKTAEVWCPPHCLSSSGASYSTSASQPSSFLHRMAGGQRRGAADRNGAGNKTLLGEDADSYLADMLQACNGCCRLGLCESKLQDTNASSSSGQTGEWKARGLHVLRATVRDQDGKRYLFVLDQDEAWKMTQGLQRLKKGAMARSLGVSGMTSSDAKNCLESLGWV